MAQVASGAKLGSPIDFTRETEHPEYTSSHYYWHRALSWGAAFIFGMLLILLLRDFFAVVANGTERFESFGLGLLLLIAIPIISVIVCITIVGLPVGIASFMLYMIAVYSAKTFVSVWLRPENDGEHPAPRRIDRKACSGPCSNLCAGSDSVPRRISGGSRSRVVRTRLDLHRAVPAHAACADAWRAFIARACCGLVRISALVAVNF